MAFVKAQIRIAPAAIGTGIKASLQKPRGAPARLTFTVSDAVGKSLGWAKGDKLEILIGEGEHHGLIRVRKNASVGDAELAHRTMARGAWYTLKLGHQPAFIDRSEVALWCRWEEVEDGWIEIVLPKWADETSPKRKMAEPLAGPKTTALPKLQGTPAPASPAKTSVTATVMGDPPPGRREMLARMGEMKG